MFSFLKLSIFVPKDVKRIKNIHCRADTACSFFRQTPGAGHSPHEEKCLHLPRGLGRVRLVRNIRQGMPQTEMQKKERRGAGAVRILYG